MPAETRILFSSNEPVTIWVLGFRIDLKMMIVPQMLGQMVFSSEPVGSSPLLAIVTGMYFSDRLMFLPMAAQNIKSGKGCIALRTSIRLVPRRTCMIVYQPVSAEESITLIAKTPMGCEVHTKELSRCCSRITLTASKNSRKC